MAAGLTWVNVLRRAPTLLEVARDGQGGGHDGPASGSPSRFSLTQHRERLPLDLAPPRAAPRLLHDPTTDALLSDLIGDRNIQIADLNCLNALLAVLRWKRHLGLYADGTGETLTTYSLYTNEISNETSDAPVQNLINNDPANHATAENLGNGERVVSPGGAADGGPAGVDEKPEDAAA